ncbi:hypothetical protein IFM60648_04738 [Aspergillus lentulus]|uniref:Uncharacterized protein n=1 Tax=Aspergillus lentulus TaxID=293939 RepID=A0ABQ1A979_ASPLE|nr:hypothetical protein IFM60648_04738 [Aspergillus lentulus]
MFEFHFIFTQGPTSVENWNRSGRNPTGQGRKKLSATGSRMISDPLFEAVQKENPPLSLSRWFLWVNTSTQPWNRQESFEPNIGGDCDV